MTPDGLQLSGTGGSNGVDADAFSAGASDINYKGIPGAVFCLGGDDGCSVDAAGKLVGAWYFAPTQSLGTDNTDTSYIADPASVAKYAPETLYTSCGHRVFPSIGGTFLVGRGVR